MNTIALFSEFHEYLSLSMLERVHLVVVREVEKHGSLTAAAEVLGLTQSALSHSIKKLEAQLGMNIWRREGRHLRLTQAGQDVLAVANQVLPQLDLAEERLRQFAQGGHARTARRPIVRPYRTTCRGCDGWFTARPRPLSQPGPSKRSSVEGVVNQYF